MTDRVPRTALCAAAVLTLVLVGMLWLIEPLWEAILVAGGVIFLGWAVPTVGNWIIGRWE